MLLNFIINEYNDFKSKKTFKTIIFTLKLYLTESYLASSAASQGGQGKLLLKRQKVLQDIRLTHSFVSPLALRRHSFAVEC